MNLKGILPIHIAAADAQQAHAGAVVNPVAPTTQPEPSNATVPLLGMALWAAAAVAIAHLVRVFTRKSIHGPERLRPDDSVWWLLMAPCASILIAGRIAPMFNLASLNLPKDAAILLGNDIFEAVVFLLTISFFVFMRTDALHSLGLRPRQIPMALLGGATLIFIVFPFIVLVGDLVGWVYVHWHLKQTNPHEVLQLLGNTHARRVIVIAVLTASFVAPCFEELLFRGMIQTLLSKLFSAAFGTQWRHFGSSFQPTQSPTPTIGSRARWAAVLMTSAGFAASHGKMEWFFPLFVLAIGLGYAYERTGNLWMTIAAHGMFNSAQILIYLYL